MVEKQIGNIASISEALSIGHVRDVPQPTHHADVCMTATEVCHFSQIEFKSNSCDISAPHGGGVFSLMWNTVNQRDEHFRY